jgi:hypothetical protein
MGACLITLHYWIVPKMQAWDRPIVAANERLHQEFNAGNYERIYEESDSTFHGDATHDQLLKTFQDIHGTLGNAITEHVTRIDFDTTNLGKFVVVTCKPRFEKGSAVETIAWNRGGDGLHLWAYRIASDALTAGWGSSLRPPPPAR